MSQRLLFAFYEYPSGFGAHLQAIEHVDQLRIELERHGVALELELVDGHMAYPEYARQLELMCNLCVQQGRPVSVFYPHVGAYLAGRESLSVNDIRALYIGEFGGALQDYEFIGTWLEGLTTLGERPPSAQVIRLPEKLAKPGEGGPWGTELSAYPRCTGIERTGRREAIFHAFLHLVGVEEGYKEETHAVKPPCNPSCWMQWVPTNGTDICGSHVQELVRFLEGAG